eukprot:SAG31_NODE_16559_length_704_cov_1.009917_1_plen_91_part_10
MWPGHRVATGPWRDNPQTTKLEVIRTFGCEFVPLVPSVNNFSHVRTHALLIVCNLEHITVHTSIVLHAPAVEILRPDDDKNPLRRRTKYMG